MEHHVISYHYPYPKVEGSEVAKTLFFQSCQMATPSVRGILALCVLGIQSSDLGLIDAALGKANFLSIYYRIF